MASQAFGDVLLTEKGAVGEIVFSRPPDNFFDGPLLQGVADALEAVDAAPHLRAVVLAADGRSFCAGMNFAGASYDPAPVYEQALRIYACRKPIVAAVQGAAIGGGLGVAVAADFRVVSPETRLSGNFVKLGFHPGFGLTITLPRLVGEQTASLLFLTGRRVGGEEAVRIGLADVLAPRPEDIREHAHKLAAEIAENAPLALLSTRATLRAGLLEAIKKRLEHELAEQRAQFKTKDFAEGVAAVRGRRPGMWTAS